jgi:hypothetical protein
LTRNQDYYSKVSVVSVDFQVIVCFMHPISLVPAGKSYWYD